MYLDATIATMSGIRRRDMLEQSLWVWWIIVMVCVLFTRRLNRILNLWCRHGWGGLWSGGKSENQKRSGTNVKSWSIIVGLICNTYLGLEFCVLSGRLWGVEENCQLRPELRRCEVIVRSTSATKRSLKQALWQLKEVESPA